MLACGLCSFFPWNPDKAQLVNYTKKNGVMNEVRKYFFGKFSSDTFVLDITETKEK